MKIRHSINIKLTLMKGDKVVDTDIEITDLFLFFCLGEINWHFLCGF